MHKIEDFLHDIKDNTEYVLNPDMGKYTTYKTGGRANIILFPENISTLVDIVLYLKKYSIPYTILGGGSNTLFGDLGFEGAVLSTSRLTDIKIDRQTKIIAECGTSLTTISQKAAELSLTGAEFLYFLPGTIGGAVFMNAGAYGSRISDIVSKISYLKFKSINTISNVKNKNIFSYKNSIFQKERLIILQAELDLKKGKKNDIIKKMKEIKRDRVIVKEQFVFPSCGCVFKNNYKIGISTGKIIDEMGLKGMEIGGAQIYNKHGNFIINKNNASPADIKKLIELIQYRIKERYGWLPERELRFIGYFSETPL